MANLKDTNTDELFVQLAEVEAQGHERLRQTTKGLIDDVKTALDARAALPSRAGDLVAEARIAEVLDVDWTNTWTGDRKTRVQYVSVRDGMGHEAVMDIQKEIPAGKYRLLFFVLPIKE